MKIQQIAPMSGRGAGLMAKMLAWAPLLRFAEFRLDPSYFANVPEVATHSSSAARAENAAAQKDAQVPNPTAVSLALYSREIGIDKVRVQDAIVNGAALGLQRYSDKQLSLLAKTFARELQVDAIAGSGSSYKMLGLSYFIKDANAAGQTAALGFTTAQQAAMNVQFSDGLNDTAGEDLFAETLDKQLYDVPDANAIICNTNIAARLNTIARRKLALGTAVDAFGKPVMTYNGVPVVVVPTTVIPQTESDGSTSVHTSVYVARFAEEGGVCFATNSGIAFTDFPEYQTYPQGVARLDFFGNLVVEGLDAVRRISRIAL